MKYVTCMYKIIQVINSGMGKIASLSMGGGSSSGANTQQAVTTAAAVKEEVKEEVVEEEEEDMDLGDLFG